LVRPPLDDQVAAQIGRTVEAVRIKLTRRRIAIFRDGRRKGEGDQDFP
jgi:hypothetical protein